MNLLDRIIHDPVLRSGVFNVAMSLALAVALALAFHFNM